MAKAPNQPTQSERFKQAARELECDDDPERFAQVVRKIAKAPPAPHVKPEQQTKNKRAEMRIRLMDLIGRAFGITFKINGVPYGAEDIRPVE